jgi:hypothetical protein
MGINLSGPTSPRTAQDVDVEVGHYFGVASDIEVRMAQLRSENTTRRCELRQITENEANRKREIKKIFTDPESEKFEKTIAGQDRASSAMMADDEAMLAYANVRRSLTEEVERFEDELSGLRFSHTRVMNNIHYLSSVNHMIAAETHFRACKVIDDAKATEGKLTAKFELYRQ